jgi:CCR4-NOT transcription complex subunit 2
MVKQPTAESSEFTISSEDFPALPGTQGKDLGMGDKGTAPVAQVSEQNNGEGTLDAGTNNNNSASRAPGAERQIAQERGVQTHSDGTLLGFLLHFTRSSDIYGH